MSTLINDGDAAFPRPVSFSEEGGTHRGTLGMSLRDYFAGQALAGQSAFPFNKYHQPEEVANACYQLSDAMLAAREAKP